MRNDFQWHMATHNWALGVVHQEEVTTTTATRPKSSLGLEMLGKK